MIRIMGVFTEAELKRLILPTLIRRPGYF